MNLMELKLPWTQAELARKLGVSRTHITLLVQGKRKLSEKLADKLADLLVDLRADKSNAEQWTFNPLVAGSSPARPTTPNNIKNFNGLAFRIQRRHRQPIFYSDRRFAYAYFFNKGLQDSFLLHYRSGT